MCDSFVGEIRIFAGNYAPRNWAFCDGQQLKIAQYSSLYSLLGTRYGGDGIQTFNLPDLRGRIPLNQGQGPGLTRRLIGEKGGQEMVTITENEMPGHSHSLRGIKMSGTMMTPQGTMFAQPSESDTLMYNRVAEESVIKQMNENTINKAGASQPHENEMPYLCINYIISLTGVYPSRS